MPSIKIQGETYELSTKLKVAFLVQKAHNHKPYTEVFKEIGMMGIEKQIEVIWLAFKEENNLKALEIGSGDKFRDLLLDESNLSYILEALTGVIEGIMYHGMSDEEVTEKKLQMEREMSNQPEN